MLPTSIIERKAFRDFLAEFDPHFAVPTRHTIKTTGVNLLREKVIEFLFLNFYT
jgi:hypothetical protein